MPATRASSLLRRRWCFGVARSRGPRRRSDEGALVVVHLRRGSLPRPRISSGARASSEAAHGSRSPAHLRSSPGFCNSLSALRGRSCARFIPHCVEAIVPAQCSSNLAQERPSLRRGDRPPAQLRLVLAQGPSSLRIVRCSLRRSDRFCTKVNRPCARTGDFLAILTGDNPGTAPTCANTTAPCAGRGVAARCSVIPAQGRRFVRNEDQHRQIARRFPPFGRASPAPGARLGERASRPSAGSSRTRDAAPGARRLARRT